MTIQITHTITLAPEVLALLQAFVGKSQPVATEAPKTTARATAAKQEPVAETASPVAETTERAAASVDISLEQVRAAVASKQATKRTELKALLTEFGSANVTGLDKAKYADFLDKVNAL